MRILSFCKKWDKLNKDEFTTFRYPRADKNWYVGEMVQVFYKNRSPNREYLFNAQIIDIQTRELDPHFAKRQQIPLLTDKEANEDGFPSRIDMAEYMAKQYGLDYISKFMKMTLRKLK